MMTPTAALTATAPELAPIVAEIMGKGWEPGIAINASVVHWDGHVGEKSHYLRPCHSLEDAFRLQDRVAELGLQREFCAWLCRATGSRLDGEVSTAAKQWHVATASPLARTRACCAAWLESKENA